MHHLVPKKPLNFLKVGNLSVEPDQQHLLALALSNSGSSAMLKKVEIRDTYSLNNNLAQLKS